jgi:hypothetical protein
MDFLEFLNPRSFDRSSLEIDMRLDGNGNTYAFHNHKIRCALNGGNLEFVSSKVKTLAKLEMAFHSLNSKIVEDYPELNDKNFNKILEVIKREFGDDIEIPTAYEITRIIRNKFQHDKQGGLSWIDNSLIIKDKSDSIKLKITHKSLDALIYFIWFILRNNMSLMYNKIISNILYHQFIVGISDYIITKNNKPWRKFGIPQRTKVNSLEPRRVTGGYIVRRINCFGNIPDTDLFFVGPKRKQRQGLLYSLDYSFTIDNQDFLIPDEFFYKKKQGKNAFISDSDLALFKFKNDEMAVF